MKNTEKAYAAGLFDGEGSISMTRVGSKATKKTGKPYWRIVVSITNCDASTIKWLHERWPGSCMWNRRAGVNKRPQHRWTLYGRRATKFLIDIKPYAMIKAYRLALAVEVNEIQSRPRKTAEPYPKAALTKLIAIRGLFDADRSRSLAARDRNWSGDQ